jgi:hypothetical protein
MKNIVLLSLVTLFSLQNIHAAKKDLYVGFYGAAGWGQNYLESSASDTLKASNMIWIRETEDEYCGGKQDCATWAIHTIQVLKYVRDNYPQTKAMIDVSPIFFNPHTHKLYTNYSFRWHAYLRNITNAGNFNNQFGAFYTLDEAYSNGEGAGINISDMKSQLENVSKTVKSSFPNLPISISYSVRTLYKALHIYPIPSGYDWIGVNCYESWDNCQGKGSMDEILSYLEKNLSSSQKMILFPETAFITSESYPSNNRDQNELLLRTKKYYVWAQQHPKVVGVFPYLWQSFGNMHETVTGLSGLSETTQEAVTNLNNKLLTNTPILTKPVILAKPSGLHPQIVQAGRGCDDNNCIWMVVKNIEKDYRIDIRKSTSTSHKVDWYYHQSKIQRNYSNSKGQSVITFRITEESAINELNNSGLKLWLVNPTSKKWSTLPTFIH